MKNRPAALSRFPTPSFQWPFTYLKSAQQSVPTYFPTTHLGALLSFPLMNLGPLMHQPPGANAADADNLFIIAAEPSADLHGSDLIKELLKLKANLTGEMEKNGEVITIPKQEFINVFNMAMLESNSQEEKTAIKKILTNLFEISKKIQ